MADTYYAGAYWLARRETSEECAQRAERFLRLLGRCDRAWTCWRDAAETEETQPLLGVLDAAAFTNRFARAEYQEGPDGFSFLLFAGDTVSTATSVRATCGSATSLYPQNCVFTPPTTGPVAERVLTAPMMTEVVRAMALAWDPEWAMATSHEHRDRVSEDARIGTFVSWVTYFSRLRGSVPPLPAPVRVEPVGDQGTVVILTPERFTVSNPEHLALATRVHELLREAGLLGPLQPWPTA